nr:ankyrin repeat domain-containing protein 30B-like [Gorilla gorilla gorilla]
MCLPDAAYQKDIKTINHKIEDQMFPSESKREEDEEYSWDSGSLFESSAKTQVCIPESIYQKVMEINREVEELPEKPSAFKPAIEMQKTVPNKAFELKNEQTLRAAQMFPSESKQKDDEENSWDSESPCETVSQKDVYLPKATHQKVFDTLNGKLEVSSSVAGIHLKHRVMLIIPTGAVCLAGKSCFTVKSDLSWLQCNDAIDLGSPQPPPPRVQAILLPQPPK